MKVLLTGGTGFIGQALCTSLIEKGYEVVVISRSAEKRKGNEKRIRFVPGTRDLDPAEGFDAVINLAGEGIADKRWSPKQKQEIIDSRLNATESLVDHVGQMPQKPKVFISGSAIGYYGVGLGDDSVSETDSGDQSFSSEICQRWEQAAAPVESLVIRTCYLRTGIVLGNGGALGRMLLPFKLGLGGRIGSGAQWMPWIHMADMIGLIEFCLTDDEASGPINCVSPGITRNADFTKTLASVLRRPAIFPMPGFVVSLLFGQMGEELLLAGKKVVPQALQHFNYTFRYPELREALSDVVR